MLGHGDKFFILRLMTVNPPLLNVNNVRLFLTWLALNNASSLNAAPYSWARETGDEIMQDYFQRFDVDNSGFDFLTYWPYEKGLLPNFLRPKSQRILDQAPKPLTLQMLIESAKAGRWLYDLKEA